MAETVNQGVNRARPGIWFVGVVFAITYLTNIGLALAGGYGKSPATMAFVQLQMLLPAFVAILLSMFVFSSSKIYLLGERAYQGRPRLFFLGYLAYVVVHCVLTVLLLLSPEQMNLYNALMGTASSILLMWLIFVRATSTAEDFQQAGLSGGGIWAWVVGWVLVVGYYAASTGANYLMALGLPVNLAQELSQLEAFSSGATTAGGFRSLLAAQMLILGPFTSLLLGFGEEWGWRGFLQGEMLRWGKRRGAVLLGVLWAIWYYPLVLMGYQFPNERWGSLLVFTPLMILMSILLSYTVLKTGSIWIAAFVHMVNNQAVGFFSGFILKLERPLMAFGYGALALIPLVVIVLLVLRDRIWQE